MKVKSSAPIAVIGAGSFGTALSIQLARAGNTVHLYDHDQIRVQRMKDERSNAAFLPGFEFPSNLALFDSLVDALQGVTDIVIVVPSHAFADCARKIKATIKTAVRIAWGTKGLDPDSHGLLHQVAMNVFGDDVALAAISGPSFAKEVAMDLPTAVTIAGNNPEFCEELAHFFHTENFRPYTSSDLVGIQICGAVKNPVAIAAGISDGLGFGANARSALITRALAEITRLGVALGGQQETFYGLAGLGDLVLTCTDDQSRNRRYGLALGKGLSSDEALKQIGQVVEGLQNAFLVKALATKNNIAMPVVEQVCAVIEQKIAPRDAVHNLLARELRSE